MLRVSPAMLATVVLALAGAGFTTSVSAQSYPTKPIKLIVPFGAGGPVDVMGRLVAQKLSASVGAMVVENRPGQGGTLGARSVAVAEPDGYTLMVATSTTMGVSANLYKNLDFDPVRSFAPVALISSVPFVLVVRPSLPIRTDARADRLRQGPSGQAQLRLSDRHAAASDRRAVPAAHRHRLRLHSLQGRQQRRHRPGRGPDRLRLRARVGADRPHQRRQGAPARGDEPHAPSANSGCSHARRRRREELRLDLLERRGRARRHAAPIVEKLNAAVNAELKAGDMRETAAAARRRGPRRNAGRFRSFHRRRSPEVGRGGESRQE